MFDLDSLLRTVGYAGVFAIVFVESGLLVGFFLPGDSLLFAAGFLASQGFFNIVILCILTFVAAVLGIDVLIRTILFFVFSTKGPHTLVTSPGCF